MCCVYVNTHLLLFPMWLLIGRRSQWTHWQGIQQTARILRSLHIPGCHIALQYSLWLVLSSQHVQKETKQMKIIKTVESWTRNHLLNTKKRETGNPIKNYSLYQQGGITSFITKTINYNEKSECFFEIKFNCFLLLQAWVSALNAITNLRRLNLSRA